MSMQRVRSSRRNGKNALSYNESARDVASETRNGTFSVISIMSNDKGRTP